MLYYVYSKGTTKQEEEITMEKEVANFLNSIGDLQERLGNAPECEMPYYDHTGDTVEDTGRNPERMAG